MATRWRGLSWIGQVVGIACLIGLAAPDGVAAAGPKGPKQEQKQQRKLERELERQADAQVGRTRVIVVLKPGVDPSQHVKELGGKIVRQLKLIDAIVVDLPAGKIRKLAEQTDLVSLHFDRPVKGNSNRAAVTIGARAIQSELGYDGAGVGVAVIDSGIANWHDDLILPRAASSRVRTVGGQRVTAFVDFVNDNPVPYDDNGHGTHVAGIIAGNGYDSYGSRAGSRRARTSSA